MSTLIYIIYAIHLTWLWGCTTYIIIEWLKNGQGTEKNPILVGWRLWASFFVVGGWFYFVLSEANIYHHDYYINYTLKLIKEIFNLASTIVCSVLLLGIGLKKK